MKRSEWKKESSAQRKAGRKIRVVLNTSTEELTCEICKKKFKPGHNAKGVPNGIGFVMRDGTRVDICRECFMESPGAWEPLRPEESEGK